MTATHIAPLTLRWLLDRKARNSVLRETWNREACQFLINSQANDWLDHPDTDAKVVLEGRTARFVEFRGKRYQYTERVSEAVEVIWAEHQDLV